ncbi:hypothetical protein [Spiroplasma sp. DGKH1]|uniref:hypothetical protein n=1 Tax=Spiroplasma sp. DGKH1 TaxID=3050074 RepID=UPI0034C69BCE
MVNKEVLLTHYQTEYQFINKLKGWCEQAKQNLVVQTDFLDLRQIEILKAVFKKAGVTNYYQHPGMVNSFRSTITINTPTPNLVVLVANQNPSAVLQHNELLGYLLNELGLELRVFGDLYVTSEIIALSCLAKVANVLTTHPLVINNQVVIFHPTNDQITINYQFDEFTKNVKSLRLDAVVSAICHLSRDNAQALIQKNNVFVNFSVINTKTFLVSYDNIISIRKYGRFRIAAIIKNKNDNYRLTIAKFK